MNTPSRSREDHERLRPRCTRLAPSPTGALHLGNARTFLITWAMARQQGWRIILRIEDLDGPRIKAGAADGIMDTLRWLGIDWDEGPIVQSDDLEPYEEAMRTLAARGMAYPCRLSRAEIEAAASAPQEGSHEVRYPASLRPSPALFPFRFDPASGSLEDASEPERGEHSWRFLVPDEEVCFDDACAGPQRINVSASVGDFIIWTKRAQPAYQLAVVVDDSRQGVTDVIRGNDLLDSAARQVLLYRALGYVTTQSGAERNPVSLAGGLLDRVRPGETPCPVPAYCHLPLVIGPDGKRLAKRHGDTRVETYRSLGVPPEAVVGLIGSWSINTAVDSPARSIRAPMTPAEFSERFCLSTMSADPIRFSEEDDLWLRSQAT